MPSAKQIPIPNPALTLSFGGVDFRLDPESLGSSANNAQVAFQGGDDNILVKLTNFTGTLNVCMSALLPTNEASAKPSRASLDHNTAAVSKTTTAKVVEESTSPDKPARAAKISPRQQQLSFGKAGKTRAAAASKKSDSESSDKSGSSSDSKMMATETPATTTAKDGAPEKPLKSNAQQNKRTLLEIQTNPVPSPLSKKSRAAADTTSDDSNLSSLLQNTSQLSQTQPSQSSNNNQEFTQGDTVDGEDEDFFLPKSDALVVDNDKSISSSASQQSESNNNNNGSSSIQGAEESSDNAMQTAAALPDVVTTTSERLPPPCQRWGHTMTKIENDRILIYGGQALDAKTNTPQILSDIQVYDMKKQTWFKPVNCEGVPRQWHTATYLPDRQLLVSFGGETKHPKTGRVATTDQVMVLDTDILLWYPPTVSGTVPSGRSGHTATMLPHTNEMVVFGGVKGSKWQNSVAVLDISRWRWSAPKVIGNAPRPRSYHTATAVSCQEDGVSRLVIFGGNNAVSSFNTVHVLETDGKRWAWVNPSVKGTIPSARTGHCATLLGDNKTIMIYGGWDPNADEDAKVDDEDIIYADSYLLNTETWEWRAGPKPAFAGDGVSVENSLVEDGGARRVGHTMVLTDKTEALVFGGRVPGDKFVNDFQTLALE